MESIKIGDLVQHKATGSVYEVANHSGEGVSLDPMNGAAHVYCDYSSLDVIDANWAALVDAERKLYADGGLGFTDVNTFEDHQPILEEMWRYADISADAVVDNDEQRRAVVAGRVARAFAVLAFGQEVGADDV